MITKQFLAELKSRGIYRAAAIYAAGAWGLLQVADVIFPIFGVGEGAIELVLYVAAAGFPIVIVFAWVYDLTSHGLVETPATHPDSARYTLSPMRVVEFALIALLIVLIGYLYVDRLVIEQPAKKYEPASSSPVITKPSIAVLPLVNMSGNPELEYFGDGLAEEILNLLARINEMDVAARTSSFYFKDVNADIPSIGRHLGVSHVLEGSVRYQQEKVRVTVQLIESENGYHLWSETYERTLDDVFSLQDEISLRVTERLQVFLSPESTQALQVTQSIDPRAFDYYLRGRHYLRRLPDEVTLSSAEAMFNEAIIIDGNYANAHSGLCDTYIARYQMIFSEEDFSNAEQSCQHALSLDDRAAPVHVALGNLYRNSGEFQKAHDAFDKALLVNENEVAAVVGRGQTQLAEGDMASAEETFARAIAMQANYWPAQLQMGNLMLRSGNTTQAIAYYERINSLLPESGLVANNLGGAYFLEGKFEDAVRTWEQTLHESVNPSVLLNLGSSYFFLRQFESAEKMYRQAADLAPEDHEAIGFLADALRMQGKTSQAQSTYREAVSLAEKSLAINPANGIMHALLGHYFAHLGEAKAATKHLSQAVQLAPEEMYIHYYAATAYAAMSDPDKALSALEKAVSLGYFRHLIRADGGFDSLRSDPRFDALI